MIKTHRPCRFAGTLCSRCIQRDICLSPSRLISGKRKFIFSLNNIPQYTIKTKQNFKKGIEFHKEKQKDIKNIEQYDYIKFRRDLYRKEEVNLSEVRICSLEHKCHGIVDLLTLHWEGNSMDVWIDEIKTHPSNNSSHYLQLMTYATILSDLNCKIIYEKQGKRKKGFAFGFLYPSRERVKYLNIKGRIFYIYGKNGSYWDIISHNQFFESSGNIKMALMKRAKEYRMIMQQKMIDIRAIEYCKGCDENKKVNCGWDYLCNRYGFNPKLKQLYMSQNKIKLNKENILIKTKPRIWR